MSVSSVFAIGTGHSRAEANTLMVRRLRRLRRQPRAPGEARARRHRRELRPPDRRGAQQPLRPGHRLGALGQPTRRSSTSLACGPTWSTSPGTAAARSCDTYSRITLADPARKRASGFGRLFRDLDAGKRVFGFSGARSLGSGFGRANAYRDDHPFINNDHARHFMASWPNLFVVLTG